MEGERLEARQAPRWSDAEAAENRARRLMTVLEGRWATATHLEPQSAIIREIWIQRVLLRMRQAAAKRLIVGIGFMRRP